MSQRIRRQIVRGDTLRFGVPNRFGSSTASSTASMDARVEFRRQPTDAVAIGSLTVGDGISRDGTQWLVEVPEHVTSSLTAPGVLGVVYYQLRATNGGDVATIEDGFIRVMPDATRMVGAFDDATAASASGDYGGF